MKFSIEAEQAVLGGILIDPSKLDVVSEIISEDDFYNIDNRLIYSTMTGMHGNSKPIDCLTLGDELSSGGVLDKVGGVGYLVELHNNTDGVANIGFYSRIIADRAIERKITMAGQRIIELGESDGSVDEKLNTLHDELASLERDEKQDVISFEVLLKQEVKDIDLRFRGESKKGLMTGFDSLDARFGGIEKDDLWILAARPSMGKTTLAINIAQNVSETGKDVLIFSLEMGKEQLVKRLLSAASSIPYGVLRSGELQEHNWPQLTSGVLKLKGRKIHVVDIAAIDVNRATAIARKYARNGNLGLIIIDYLQLMTAKTDSRFDEVSEVSRRLKAMAKTTGCPVLALSQLSRDVEKRKPPIPNNSDLRESGQIEQDADIISFIYRDEVYNPDSTEKGIAQIHTTKFRNGETGIDFLASKLQFSRFENMTSEYVRLEPIKEKRRGFSY